MMFVTARMHSIVPVMLVSMVLEKMSTSRLGVAVLEILPI